MGITIKKVSSRKDMQTFLTLPWKIYADDPLWVPPVLPERRKKVSPDRGVFFKRGRADFFIAYRNGKPAGTICAAEDPPTNSQRGRADCMIGFYECIDDPEVATALFDKAADWARSQGLEYLFGPFNLDYEDSHGVLVEGRDRPPVLMCGHSPSYYLEQFTGYGFEKERRDSLAFSFVLDPESPGLRRLDRLGKVARSRGDVTVRHVNLDDMYGEIDRIHKLLVRSLAHLDGSVPWRRDALESTLVPLKDLVDPELVLFAEHDGEAVGWFPGIPNFNEVFMRLDGLRRPWNYLGLLRGLKRKTRCLAVKSLLVLPEYWNTGAATLLFDEMAKRAFAKGYEWVDLSLTGEDNPQTPVIAGRLGAQEYKRYRVFIKKL